MIDVPCTLYMKRIPQWQVIRDCVEGEDAIKRMGTKYLPRHQGSTNVRYEAYKTRAKWVNYVSQTLEGLHGMITRRAPTIDASDEFLKSGILENIDRKGHSLYQFSSDTLYDAMQTCFGGYLADMPRADDVISVFDAEKKDVRPYLRYYPAESVFNWHYEDVDGTEKLSQVVLREKIESSGSDEFERKEILQFRVLDFDENGFYRQRIFSSGGERKRDTSGKMRFMYEPVEEISVKVKGKKLRYIPFVFIPYENPEKPMLYDLACINLCYYRESADYENGVHLTTLPTLVVTGWDPPTDKNGEKAKLSIGGDVALTFEDKDTKVDTKSFSGVGLQHCEIAMSKTESQMAILGSRIIAPDKAMAETAEAARIHRAGENAKLASFTRNMSEKLTEIVTIIANWAGFNESIKISLNTDYETLSFDPNALNALANLSREGKLPLQYIFYSLKKGEYLPDDATFEDYAKMLDFEETGATKSEILEFYKSIRSGESPDISNRNNHSVYNSKNNKESKNENIERESVAV